MYIHVYTYTIMTTKLTKWGNSYGIRVSRSIVEELSLKDGQELDLKVSGNVLEIKPKVFLPIKYSLEELVAQIPKDYSPEVIDWGPDVGREILPPYNPDEI